MKEEEDNSTLKKLKEYRKQYHNKRSKDPLYLERRRIASSKYSKSHRNICNKHSKDYQRKLKKLIIDNYGGKCVCCNTSVFEFLTVDHINNDGNDHRKSLGTVKLYIWLKKNNFPKDNYQLLCMNCNSAKGFYKLSIEDIKVKIELSK